MDIEIINLTVKAKEKLVLDKFNLKINSGEVHVIMGPNGMGKSTLAKVIMASPEYEIVSGDILVDGRSILSLTTDERARLGIFYHFKILLQ